MSKTTERMLQIAAAAALIYFGYLAVEKAVIWPLQERQGRIIAEQRVQQCTAELAKHPKQ